MLVDWLCWALRSRGRRVFHQIYLFMMRAMECEVEGGMCVGVESANADSSHNIDVLSVLDKENCDAPSNSPDDIGQLGRCDVPLDVLDVRVGLAVSHLDGHRGYGATRLAADRTRRRSSR